MEPGDFFRIYRFSVSGVFRKLYGLNATKNFRLHTEAEVNCIKIMIREPLKTGAKSKNGQGVPDSRKADEVRLYALRGGLTTKMARTAHFRSHEVFRGDLLYLVYHNSPENATAVRKFCTYFRHNNRRRPSICHQIITIWLQFVSLQLQNAQNC